MQPCDVTLFGLGCAIGSLTAASGEGFFPAKCIAAIFETEPVFPGILRSDSEIIFRSDARIKAQTVAAPKAAKATGIGPAASLGYGGLPKL